MDPSDIIARQQDPLGTLLAVTLDFTLLVVLFAVFSALMVTALVELGLRSRINRRIFSNWEREAGVSGAIGRIFKDHDLKTSFRLPYRQFCAVLSSRARNRLGDQQERVHDMQLKSEGRQQELEDLRNASDPNAWDAVPPSQNDVEVQITAAAELAQLADATSGLQQRLGYAWFRWNYALCFATALVLGTFIYASPNKYEPNVGFKRQVQVCGTEPAEARWFGDATPTLDCTLEERKTSTVFFTDEFFLLCTISFFASLLAPIFVDQIERRLLLR